MSRPTKADRDLFESLVDTTNVFSDQEELRDMLRAVTAFRLKAERAAVDAALAAAQRQEPGTPNDNDRALVTKLRQDAMMRVGCSVETIAGYREKCERAATLAVVATLRERSHVWCGLDSWLNAIEAEATGGHRE
jgi:hypothetical protein